MTTPGVPPALRDVAAVLRGFADPWCVAGGWAVDLFLDRPTRPHADVDLALFRDGQARLREHLPAWRFSVARGGVLEPWRDGEWLAPPAHEIHGRGGEVAAEFLLNERDGDQWVFRRDPSVRRPAAGWIVPTPSGLPALCPAIVLLFKAKQPRPADEHDFHALRGHLPAERRAWLADALHRVHPGHPWIEGLRPTRG
jgi:hypothetical protein